MTLSGSNRLGLFLNRRSKTIFLARMAALLLMIVAVAALGLHELAPMMGRVEYKPYSQIAPERHVPSAVASAQNPAFISRQDFE